MLGQTFGHSLCMWPWQPPANQLSPLWVLERQRPPGTAVTLRCGPWTAFSQGEPPAASEYSYYSAKRSHSRHLLSGLCQHLLAVSCQSVFTGKYFVFEGLGRNPSYLKNATKHRRYLRYMHSEVHIPEAHGRVERILPQEPGIPG